MRCNALTRRCVGLTAACVGGIALTSSDLAETIAPQEHVALAGPLRPRLHTWLHVGYQASGLTSHALAQLAGNTLCTVQVNLSAVCVRAQESEGFKAQLVQILALAMARVSPLSSDHTAETAFSHCTQCVPPYNTAS
jgi:hypothetical protein